MSVHYKAIMKIADVNAQSSLYSFLYTQISKDLVDYILIICNLTCHLCYFVFKFDVIFHLRMVFSVSLIF